MPPTLTLHQGDGLRADYTEHPIEVARKALIAAAEMESGRWPDLLRQTASLLPERSRIMRGEEE